MAVTALTNQRCITACQPSPHVARPSPVTARLQWHPTLCTVHARSKHSHERADRIRAQGGGDHGGHAVLHDFCMTIPYGGLAAISGLVAFAFKAPAVGLQLAAAAAIVGLCSVMSLKSWKAGGSSTAYTLASAGASGWVAFQMWQRVAASLAPVPSGIMLALSAALCVFCLYNILAGGNPPPNITAA